MLESERVDALLDLLLKGTENMYNAFLIALEETGQERLAKILENPGGTYNINKILKHVCW